MIDRALYLPKSWMDDRERCRAAGIGDEVEFATKVQLAKAMVRRAIDDGIPFRRVTADAGYGYSKGWRYELEQADVFHVVATTRHDTVVTRRALDHPLHDLMADLPRQKWKRRSCGEGAHGLRLYDWARVEVRPWHRPDRRHWGPGLPQHHRPHEDRLLHRLRARRGHPQRADHCRGRPLGHRGVFPDRQGPVRPRRLPNPTPPGVVPAHQHWPRPPTPT